MSIAGRPPKVKLPFPCKRPFHSFHSIHKGFLPRAPTFPTTTSELMAG